jgi:cytosine/adenosine deaminase-related metal-dependent hydrolase
MLDAAAMTAERVLEMATIGGARALGLDGELGSLELGKSADIIVIDFERLNLWPPLRPVIDIVYGGMETDVEATIINGEVVMENGKLTKIDEHDLLASTEETAWNLIEKSKTWDLINATILGWRMPQVRAVPQKATIEAS